MTTREKPPAYDLRPCKRDDILPLIEQFHAYRSLGNNTTYLAAVFEDGRPVAAYAWQPPAFGAAKSVCPEAPHGVLALSRMVAVPRDERRLKHISKPLRRMMRQLIDRTRWPVLVTYSDEGLGHDGYVYKCSGWKPTLKSTAPVKLDDAGRRVSVYQNGKFIGGSSGTTVVQRWENWICLQGEAAQWMRVHGWQRVAVPGKVWRSGNPAFTYVRELAAAPGRRRVR